MTDENRKGTKMTLDLNDIKCILHVWHGKFNHNDTAMRKQAIKTYDKLCMIQCELKTAKQQEWTDAILEDFKNAPVKDEISKGAE